MRVWLTTFLLLIALPAWPQTTIEKITAGMKADCAAQWPSDFAMQEYCYGRQVDSYNNLVPVSRDEKDENLRGALAKCLDEWESSNGQDWAMVEYCYGRQRDAYRRMKGG